MFKNAKRIWLSSLEEPDEYADFTDTFSACKGKRYILDISADTDYNVYINSTLVAFGQYADYPDKKIYDEIDISEYIRDGENTLLITAWHMGTECLNRKIQPAEIIFEIFCDNSSVLCSDVSTQSRLSPFYVSHRRVKITDQLGLSFRADAAAKPTGFAASRAVTALPRETFPRPIKKLDLLPRLPAEICQYGSFVSRGVGAEAPGSRMQNYYISTRLLRKRDFSEDFRFEKDKQSDGIYFIVDIGEESSGFVDFDMTFPCECEMEIGFGEHLADGRCRTSKRNFTFEYHAKAGRNTFLSSLRRIGCRYIQFFIFAPEISVSYAGLRPTVYPLNVKKFKSTNLLRDTIYGVCEDTLIHCMHEHYEDCPWREQGLYTMDSRNQMLCGYYAFGEKEFPRASLDLISQGMRTDGLLSITYPTDSGITIPSFSLVHFIQLREYIEYTGDIEFVRERYEIYKTLLDTFISKPRHHGLVENFYGEGGYWNFYEWSYGLDGKFNEDTMHIEAPLNALLSLALGNMAQICNYLGKTEDKAHYLRLEDELNQSIAEYFFDENALLFRSFDDRCKDNFSVLTNSLCLLCGAADKTGKSKENIIGLLLSNGENRDGAVPATLSMCCFRYDALLRENKKYLGDILSEIDKTYLYMLRGGATTFWETIKGERDFDSVGSLCHGWSALPIYYYELAQKTEDFKF